MDMAVRKKPHGGQRSQGRSPTIRQSYCIASGIGIDGGAERVGDFDAVLSFHNADPSASYVGFHNADPSASYVGFHNADPSARYVGFHNADPPASHVGL